MSVAILPKTCGNHKQQILVVVTKAQEGFSPAFFSIGNYTPTSTTCLLNKGQMGRFLHDGNNMMEKENIKLQFKGVVE